jgi:hypothetical protein
MKNPDQYVYRYTPTWVRILTFFLASFFIVLGILTIITVQGNVINLKEAEIIPSGSIRINSNVDNFEVFINGQKKLLVDNIINGLPEGDYIVKITKNKYIPYETVTFVKNGLVIDVNVHLFLEKPVLSKAIDQPVQQIYLSEQKDFLFALDDEFFFKKSFNKSLLSFFESDTQILFNSQSEISKLFNDKTKISPSPSGEFILIETNSKIYILPTSGNLNYADPEEFLITPPYLFTEAKWLDEKNIIFSSENMLFNFNHKEKSSTIINISNENNLYYFINKAESRVYFSHNDSLYQFKDNTVTNMNIPSSIISEHKLIFANKEKAIFTKDYETIIYYFDFDKFYTIDDFLAIKINNNANVIQGYNSKQEIVAAEIIKRITTQEIQIIPIMPSDEFKQIDLNSINWAPNDAYFTFQNKKDPYTIYASPQQMTTIIPVYESSEKIYPTTLISQDNKSILVITSTPKMKNVFRIETE